MYRRRAPPPRSAGDAYRERHLGSTTSSTVSTAPSAKSSNRAAQRPVRLRAATLEFSPHAVVTSFRVGAVALLLALSGSGGSARAQDDESVRALVARIERIVQS